MFQYLQIPPCYVYCQIPLLANSASTEIHDKISPEMLLLLGKQHMYVYFYQVILISGQ